MKMSKKNYYNGCYGEFATISEIKDLILRTHENNCNNKTKSTICIWGIPGIGKTSLVKDLKNTEITFKNQSYSGFDIVDIPLAQNEEMGDLHGIPETFLTVEKDGKKEEIIMKESVIDYFLKNGYKPTNETVTKNIPPKWVPIIEKPGIILFDDANRASTRIIKGIMQLIQDYKTISWQIPNGYTLVLTGNPDNSDYEVNSFDSAMITRMIHVTLKPDIKEWMKWAYKEQDLDQRGVSWLGKYGQEFFINNENMDTRTNFRTFAEFCRILKRYPDLKNPISQRNFYIDANGIIDSEITNSFIIFNEKEMELFYMPEDILDGKVDYIRFEKEMKEATDSIYIICYRLVQYLISKDYIFNPNHVKPFQKFIEMDIIPIDTKTVILSQFIKYENNKITVNPNIKNLIVGSQKIKDCYCKLLETYKCTVK